MIDEKLDLIKIERNTLYHTQIEKRKGKVYMRMKKRAVWVIPDNVCS